MCSDNCKQTQLLSYVHNIIHVATCKFEGIIIILRTCIEPYSPKYGGKGEGGIIYKLYQAKSVSTHSLSEVLWRVFIKDDFGGWVTGVRGWPPVAHIHLHLSAGLHEVGS